MTVNELDKMNKIEREKFFSICDTFDKSIEFDQYKIQIRDYQYLWYKYEKNKEYTIEDANKFVEDKESEINSYYREKESPGGAIIFLEYACG